MTNTLLFWRGYPWIFLVRGCLCKILDSVPRKEIIFLISSSISLFTLIAIYLSPRRLIGKTTYQGIHQSGIRRWLCANYLTSVLCGQDSHFMNVCLMMVCMCQQAISKGIVVSLTPESFRPFDMSYHLSTIVSSFILFLSVCLLSLLFKAGYYFSTGPFGKFWIKKEYDPRKDPESRM